MTNRSKLIFLIYGIALTLVGAGLMGWQGAAIATVIVLFWAATLRLRKGKRLLSPIACLLLSAAICSGVWYIDRHDTELVNERNCAEIASARQNIRHLALAASNYQSSGGSYPSAHLEDDDGEPKHSWRVLVLPFLGKDELRLYEEYRMEEPWDSPHNLKVAEQLPNGFAGGAIFGGTDRTQATFKLVTGSGTAFVDNETYEPEPDADDFWAFIEDRQNPVLWTKPEDISLGDAVALFDIQRRPKGMSFVKEGYFNCKEVLFFHVATAWGAIVDVNPLVEPERVRDFFSPTKKPDATFDTLERCKDIVNRSIKWPRVTLLIGFVVLTLAPTSFAWVLGSEKLVEDIG